MGRLDESRIDEILSEFGKIDGKRHLFSVEPCLHSRAQGFEAPKALSCCFAEVLRVFRNPLLDNL